MNPHSFTLYWQWPLGIYNEWMVTGFWDWNSCENIFGIVNVLPFTGLGAAWRSSGDLKQEKKCN